jgi:hypothetical protein
MLRGGLRVQGHGERQEKKTLADVRT